MKFSKYLKAINILYVEDDKMTNKTIKEVLLCFNYKITAFVDPTAALDYFLSNSKNIDLVISDINMPLLSGVDLAKQIKQKNKKIPIILYTAFSEEKYLLEAISLGISDYLKKPINFKELRNSINKAIYPIYLEKRNLEQNRLINQQSKDLLIAKTVSMISHQWKQPLTKVSSIVSKLKVLSEFDELDKNSLKENLNKIEKENKNLASVINRFEDVLKKKKPEYFSIEQLFKDCFELLSLDQTKLVEINVSIKEDFYIFSNLNEFKTVILNLLINCIDNIKNKKVPNGKINVEVILEENCSYIKITDNALGMDEGKINKAFNLYYSDENLNKKGLGLYFVRLSLSLLVEGSIDIKNVNLNMQKGLEVKIKIPSKYIKTNKSISNYQI